MFKRAKSPLHTQKQMLEPCDSTDNDSSDEIPTKDRLIFNALAETEDCIVPGRSMNLHAFEKVAEVASEAFLSSTSQNTNVICKYNLNISLEETETSEKQENVPEEYIYIRRLDPFWAPSTPPSDSVEDTRKKESESVPVSKFSKVNAFEKMKIDATEKQRTVAASNETSAKGKIQTKINKTDKQNQTKETFPNPAGPRGE